MEGRPPDSRPHAVLLAAIDIMQLTDDLLGQALDYAQMLPFEGDGPGEPPAQDRSKTA